MGASRLPQETDARVAAAQVGALDSTAARAYVLRVVHPAYCPRCAERVTPYAAGCAQCGAELDPSRWHSRLSFRRRLSYYLPKRVRLAQARRAARDRSG